MRDRLIDPMQRARNHLDHKTGVTPIRDVTRDVGRIKRADRGNSPVVVSTTFSFYRANVGSLGDASYLLQVGIPSGVAAWASATIPLVQPVRGRIVAAHLWSSEAVTAGSGTLLVQTFEGASTTAYTLAGCRLDAANPQTAAVWLPYDTAPSFAAGATIRALLTTVGFAPTTADVGALVVVAHEP